MAIKNFRRKLIISSPPPLFLQRFKSFLFFKLPSIPCQFSENRTAIKRQVGRVGSWSWSMRHFFRIPTRRDTYPLCILFLPLRRTFKGHPQDLTSWECLLHFLVEKVLKILTPVPGIHGGRINFKFTTILRGTWQFDRDILPRIKCSIKPQRILSWTNVSCFVQ